MLESSMIAALRAQALPLLPDDNLDAVMVQIGDASVRHSSREGGVSTFSIALHEAAPTGAWLQCSQDKNYS